MGQCPNLWRKTIMFNAMIETLKANPRKIVFTEGHDARILEATARLVEGGFLTPVLVGNVDDVKKAAADGGFDIDGLEISLAPEVRNSKRDTTQSFRLLALAASIDTTDISYKDAIYLRGKALAMSAKNTADNTLIVNTSPLIIVYILH